MTKTDELQHGETVTSKFFKGTGVVIGFSEVRSDRKVRPDELGNTQTLVEVGVPDEDFRLRIRPRELERADVS